MHQFVQHILGDSPEGLMHADTSAGMNCSTVCWGFCYKDPSRVQGGTWTGAGGKAESPAVIWEQPLYSKVKHLPVLGPSVQQWSSVRRHWEKRYRGQSSVAAWWEAEKERAVSCGVSQQQLCCRECRAVGNPSPSNAQRKKLNWHQDGVWLKDLPALPGLLWAALRRILSVGA